MNIPLLLLTIIFAIWLRYEIAKSNEQQKRSFQYFLQREREANATRRKDISNLNYITVDLKRLPLKDSEDDTVNSYRDTIVSLANCKIVNLTGLTNTDLKYRYGAANLELLSEYDSNFTKLVSFLHKWGERLYHNGKKSDAVLVLEYAVSCGSDVTKTYRLLAKIYKEKNTLDQIDYLIDLIPSTTILRKDALIQELKQIKVS